MTHIGEAWPGLGSNCLNYLLAAHVTGKVRGLGALWRDGDGDRMRRRVVRRSGSRRRSAHGAWPLLSVLLMLSLVSLRCLPPSVSLPGISGLPARGVLEETPPFIARLTPSRRNSLLLSGGRAPLGKPRKAGTGTFQRPSSLPAENPVVPRPLEQLRRVTGGESGQLETRLVDAVIRRPQRETLTGCEHGPGWPWMMALDGLGGCAKHGAARPNAPRRSPELGLIPVLAVVGRSWSCKPTSYLMLTT